MQSDCLTDNPDSYTTIWKGRSEGVSLYTLCTLTHSEIQNALHGGQIIQNIFVLYVEWNLSIKLGHNLLSQISCLSTFQPLKSCRTHVLTMHSKYFQEYSQLTTPDLIPSFPYTYRPMYMFEIDNHFHCVMRFERTLT